jgi:nucleotide-binding universal stress UspA family protein
MERVAADRRRTAAVNGPSAERGERTLHGLVVDEEVLRFVLGVDERVNLADLVNYVGKVGADGRVIAHVVHVVELVGRSGGLTRATIDDTSALIDEAVFLLQMAGIATDGIVRHGRPSRVGLVLLEEASTWRADAIVLRARRASGRQHLRAPGVREQVLRRSRIVTMLV